MLREFVRYLVENKKPDFSAQAAQHSQKAGELFGAGDIEGAQRELGLAIEKSGLITSGQQDDKQVDAIYADILNHLAEFGIEDIPVSRENIGKFVGHMGTLSENTQITALELPTLGETLNTEKEEILRREYPHVNALFEDNQDEYLYKKALTSLIHASDGLPVSIENRQMAFYNYWKRWCEETGYKPEEKVTEGKGSPKMIKREDAINFLWYVHDVFMPRGTAYGLQKKI